MKRFITISLFGIATIGALQSRVYAENLAQPAHIELLPTPDDMAGVFPVAARAAGISGFTVVTCKVETNHMLSACAVSKEEPPRFGFAEAALRLTAFFRVVPETISGAPKSDGLITLPIRFVFPTDEGEPIGNDAFFPIYAHWLSRPTRERLNAVHPSNNAGAGSAHVACNVNADGGLANCVVRQESPAGAGFGAAALALSGFFRAENPPASDSIGPLTVELPLYFPSVMHHPNH